MHTSNSAPPYVDIHFLNLNPSSARAAASAVSLSGCERAYTPSPTLPPCASTACSRCHPMAAYSRKQGHMAVMMRRAANREAWRGSRGRAGRECTVAREVASSAGPRNWRPSDPSFRWEFAGQAARMGLPRSFHALSRVPPAAAAAAAPAAWLAALCSCSEVAAVRCRKEV